MDDFRQHNFLIEPLWAIRWPLLVVGNAAALLVLYVLGASPRSGGEMIDLPDRFVELALETSEVEREAWRGGGSPDAGGGARVHAEERKREPRKPATGRSVDVDDVALTIVPVDRSPPPPPGEPDAAPSAEAEAVRRWFPESFLWRPLVETGEDGVASLEVVLPDQLTTWRVLALAHDRAGQQAGAVHTFATALPVYVDPVVPGWLYAGDQLRLPVTAVNASVDPLQVELGLSAGGALRGEGLAHLALAPGASAVRVLSLVAEGAGDAIVRADLSAGPHSDSVQRKIVALPAGRPVVSIRGATLSGERDLQLPAPPGADPATDELSVVVFPGPLAVLSEEIERLSGGAVPQAAGYGFALASRVRALGRAAGVALDEGALRRLQLVAWQRIVRSARAPDPGQAADLLEVLAQVPAPGEVGGHAPAHELRPRLVRQVLEGQRADGTWSRDPSSTLQRVLIDTAVAIRSLPADAPGVAGARLRASGAVERYTREIRDGYTAAVILAAGLGDASLLEVVQQGLSRGDDGAFTVRAPPGARTPRGERPSHAELLAWTVLALPGDHEARGDLVAELMGRWDAVRGFGAGHADVVALDAVVRSLPVVAQQIDLTLSVGGEVVDQVRLDPGQPKVPAELTAAPGDGEIHLAASPPLAGLAVVATRRSWVPWSDADRVPGVDVSVEVGPMALGRVGTVTITAAAPSGTRLVLEQGLPAGAVAGPAADRIAREAGVQLTALPDRLVLETRPFQPGEILELSLPVQPAFAGRLQTAPLLVSVDGGPRRALAPAVWRVGG